MNIETIRHQEQSLINTLRQNEDLPPKTISTRRVYGAIVAKNPEEVRVTGTKEKRGFMYLNLNGGNSWGYYHPAENPKILFNFKGEPNYLIREIAPSYYEQAMSRVPKAKENKQAIKKQIYIKNHDLYLRQAMKSGTKLYLAFREKTTDQYYIGYHDPANFHNAFDSVASKDRIRDYLTQHDQPKPEFIETWDYGFHPNNPAVFDLQNRLINKFEPSVFMQQAKKIEEATIPDTIKRVITHALGDDPELTQHFLNWLAVIFQYRIRTQTAWILQGTTGTGKGLLISQIVQPLIGDQFCRSVTLQNMEEGFNKFMEQCLVIFIDEVDTDQVRDMSKLMAKLKNLITEDRIALRAMRTDLTEVPNHLNIMMASNQPNSMRIEDNDRRFNVCPRQEQKILKGSEDGAKFIAQIKLELPAFANYLMSHKADCALARTALDTQAKRDLKVVTQTAIEEVVQALREGNLLYFATHKPVGGYCYSPRTTFAGASVDLPLDYNSLYLTLLAATSDGRSYVLTHKDLFILFETLVGRMPNTPIKLGKRLAHAGIHLKPHTINATSVRGYKVKWRGNIAYLKETQKELPSDSSTTPTTLVN